MYDEITKNRQIRELARARTHFFMNGLYKRQKLGLGQLGSTGSSAIWPAASRKSGHSKSMGQAVKSATLAIAFDTVASKFSFQPTGDLDDGACSEEKKNSRFPRLLEERSTWLDYDHASLSMSCALCKTHFQRKTSGGGFGRDDIPAVADFNYDKAMAACHSEVTRRTTTATSTSSERRDLAGTAKAAAAAATPAAAAAVATPPVLQSAEAFQQMVQQMPVGLAMRVMQWQQAATQQGAAGNPPPPPPPSALLCEHVRPATSTN